MTNSRVVITGAAGLIGRALTKHYGAIGLTHADLDITDPVAVRRVIRELRPNVIINCAVLGVEASEKDGDAASAVNVEGPATLAAVAERHDASLVHFSTNYVFDGRGKKVYGVEDDPNPVNEYGRSKLTGECAVFVRSSRVAVIRTSWVFGPGKDSFVSAVHKRLLAGERVRSINDIFASVTYVEDLVRGVAAIVESGRYGLHHVVNEGVCSYESFAKEAARISGASEALVEPAHARDVYRVQRPAYTPLRSSIPLRNWREALSEYILSETRGP